jgi:PAS domain S-box-containing protein
MGKPLRLLIIEDVEDHALLIVRELQKGGFEPNFERVESLQELRDALAGRSWDAVISDFNLPGFDGLDVLRVMQEMGVDLPFLLVSGAIGEEKAAEVMKAGAHDYIRKGNYARLCAVMSRELADAAVRHERRMTAVELTRHREHLEDLVRERTDELSRANEALQAEIAERRRAEEALQQSQRKLFMIFHNVPSLIAITTMDGTLLDINETALQLLGYQREEVLGRSTVEIASWGDQSQWGEVLRSLQEQRAVRNHEIAFKGKSGERFIGLLSAQTMEFDNERFVLLTARDITERKQAEEALRNSEEQLRFATLAADLGVWHYDVLQNKLIWSDRCKELFDFPPDRDVDYDSFLGAIHEGDRERVDAAVQKSLQERSEYVVEMRVPLPGGRVRWVMSKGHGFYDAQENPVRMHGIAFDITQRKRAEDEIARLNSDLAARVAELEERNQDLEAFNRMVSHDLRQPLNTMGLAAQNLQFLCSKDLDERCVSAIVVARDAVQRMNTLVETLLKFAGSTHGELRRETVDLADIANSIISEAKANEPERRVTFICDHPLPAYGDWNLLRTVLENLLGNAWKYTGNREEAVIEMGCLEAGDCQTYFVRDNGKGFDMADAGNLFVPFKRLPDSEEFKGSGIGLATVERIIRRHGGRIWAESEPDKGAAFYFTLGQAQQ